LREGSTDARHEATRSEFAHDRAMREASGAKLAYDDEHRLLALDGDELVTLA
jgi:hypothetical protein